MRMKFPSLRSKRSKKRIIQVYKTQVHIRGARQVSFIPPSNVYVRWTIKTDGSCMLDMPAWTRRTGQYTKILRFRPLVTIDTCFSFQKRKNSIDAPTQIGGVSTLNRFKNPLLQLKSLFLELPRDMTLGRDQF